jgi:cytochrome d ubiquinol oxidase subunit I
LWVAIIPTMLQPISGDYAGRVVADTQPAKLAAMEGQFETQAWAPLRIGGVPDLDARVTRYALEIPGGLSILAGGNPETVVTGLNDIPPEDWPPVRAVHLSFQVMVGIGVLLAVMAIAGAWLAWRGQLYDARRYLRLLVACAPLGFIAIEAGWMVTELGRQPWIIQGVMRTSDAVTPASGVVLSLAVIAAIYVGLAVVVALLMRRHVLETRPEA